MKSLLPRIGNVPPSETLTPCSHKERTPRFPKENVDPNTMPPESALFKSPLTSGKPPKVRIRSPFPPRPPSSSNRLKRKLSLETLPENGCTTFSPSDCGVQVVVRMRPLGKEEEGVQIVQKTSPNSVSILEHSFTFDSVVDESVHDYHSHTYPDFEPPVRKPRPVRLNETHARPQLRNCLQPFAPHQAFDLNSRDLRRFRSRSRTAIAESDASASSLLCQIPRHSTENGLISLRTSRINLVDLAGSERQRATGAAGERLKEAGSINRSLSQLGNLINILAEVSQSGKHRHIPYRDSRLTFLLQESLGGNAKLAMICNVSPSKSCKNETFSTLRFAQRAKAIKNKAIVNETTVDDANLLREQIRQLKDELLRMKSNDKSEESNGSCSIGWNVRRSLSLLRFSLCRPRTLPVEDDSDEDMEIVQEGVESSGAEAYLPSLDEENSTVNEEATKFESFKEKTPCYLDRETSSSECLKKIPSFISECHQDIECRHGSEEHEKIEELTESCRAHVQSKEIVEIAIEQASPTLDMNEHNRDGDEKKMIPAKRKLLAGDHPEITEEISSIGGVASNEMFPGQSHNHASTFCFSIKTRETSPVLTPTLSVSPRTKTYSRKSPRTSSSTSASQKSIRAEVERDLGIVNVSFSGLLNKSKNNISSIHSSKNSLATNENLAASLRQGLEVINGQKHSSSLMNSSFRFSLNPADMKPLTIMDKIDTGTQTLFEEPNGLEDSSVLICNSCKRKALTLENGDITWESDLQMAPLNGSQSSKKPQPAERCKKQVPKAMEKVLAGAIRREMALEDRCLKQAAEIMHLNRLVQQYKHERGCIEIIEQAHEDKISRLEGLMDGVMPTEEFMEKEFLSLKNEYMILKEKYDNHPEVLLLNIELKKVQNELNNYRNFFDMGERDVLMEEIHDLRHYLRYYIDSSSTSNHPLLQLTHSMGSILAPLSKISDTKDASVDENFELKRGNWTDLENKWISLYKELKTELEACQSLTEKLKIDLESEKKCAQERKEELQTALQVHTRTLEHYADLEEKHMALLQKHRKMREGILDVKKVAARVGVKCDSKFIESMSAQIETLREEREKERLYWRDENKGLQTQLKDTAEAVLAAGELLTRLKEAEDAAGNAKKRALIAEKKTERAYQEIDELKKKYESQIVKLNQLLAESHSTKDGRVDEFSSATGHNSWFYGYDRCNI
ncbi:Kinesin-like protein KIN12B [Dendrobium catenatum]|uniref:Kinesin-like protein KIN12B n=1 Tax=Dendrobium catenatum TaxID=906689 RepID=A0A2I0WKH3_9ASPA|nr:Kinesin-like protein KIN12B [Dendrobium catenatum]